MVTLISTYIKYKRIVATIWPCPFKLLSLNSIQRLVFGSLVTYLPFDKQWKPQLDGSQYCAVCSVWRVHWIKFSIPRWLKLARKISHHTPKFIEGAGLKGIGLEFSLLKYSYVVGWTKVLIKYLVVPLI